MPDKINTNINIETVVSTCPYCKGDVVSFWSKRGFLFKEDCVLAADWIYHRACWDKQLEKNPP